MNLINDLIASGHNDLIILEPRFIFDQGIISYEPNNNRLIYGYEKTIDAMAQGFLNLEGVYIDKESAYIMAGNKLENIVINELPLLGKNAPAFSYEEGE